MVRVGDKLIIYYIFDTSIVPLKDEKVLIVNNKKFTFDHLDKDVKKYKNVNRIHKPIALLFYTDWKNNTLTKDMYTHKQSVTINEKLKDFINNMEIVR